MSIISDTFLNNFQPRAVSVRLSLLLAIEMENPLPVVNYRLLIYRDRSTMIITVEAKNEDIPDDYLKLF